MKIQILPVLWFLCYCQIFAQTLPTGFKAESYVKNLKDPDVMAFSPDGRLFVGERISGNLRVVGLDGAFLPTPYLTLGVPSQRHRSAGLRGITFHYSYPDSPYVYVFYMTETPRFNRVSRFTTNPADPNTALPQSEMVLLEVPSNGTGATGSHNGGGLLFGKDNMLYITTGDGWQDWETWKGGDPVQSLSSFTGKLLRIDELGGIPSDNPFYNQASGNYRAIYALGFRNPYTLSKHPVSGIIYVADVEGSNKDVVKKISAGGNYKYERTGSWNQSLGTEQGNWVSTGHRIISGGVWYSGTKFPAEYHNSFFAISWGTRAMVNYKSESDVTKTTFGTGLSGEGGGPVYLIQGPHDGNLYWLSTDYETDKGEVLKISYDDGSPIKETNNVNLLAEKIKLKITSNIIIIKVDDELVGAELTAFNTKGKVVYSQRIKKPHLNISTQNFSNGLSMLKFSHPHSNRFFNKLLMFY